MILLASCRCNLSGRDFYLSQRTEAIIIGIFSSAVLLLFNEVIQWMRDYQKYSFLKGKYKRTEIYQILEGGKRWNNHTHRINDDTEIKNDSSVLKVGDFKYQFIKNVVFQNDEPFVEYAGDSCYMKLRFYDKNLATQRIELKYQSDGRYSGFADYNEGRKNITITLDSINEKEGKGVYQYIDKPYTDNGTYRIQVDVINIKKLYVYYKNTIPSGLAEGYEVWEKL